MKPSDKKRKRAMLFSSPRFVKKLWLILSIFLLVLIVPIILFIMIKSSTPIGTIILAMLFIVIFIAGMYAFAMALLSSVHKKLTKNIIIKDPIVENRINFHDLCVEALKINNEDNPWFVETHEDEGWIDVTWKWKDSFDYEIIGENKAVDKNTEVFYKFFKVYDDYTYDDLDMITSTTSVLQKQGLSFDNNMYMGHITTKQFKVVLSSEKDKNLGVRNYTIDSTSLTNFMYEWFANHGYKYRGM